MASVKPLPEPDPFRKVQQAVERYRQAVADEGITKSESLRVYSDAVASLIESVVFFTEKLRASFASNLKATQILCEHELQRFDTLVEGTKVVLQQALVAERMAEGARERAVAGVMAKIAPELQEEFAKWRVLRETAWHRASRRRSAAFWIVATLVLFGVGYSATWYQIGAAAEVGERCMSHLVPDRTGRVLCDLTQ